MGQKPSVLDEWTVSGARFDSPLYLHREDRCQELMKTLEKNAVVLIRSPPLTGKTTMCSEMAVYADERGLQVLNISLLDFNAEEESFDVLFKRKIQRTFRQILCPPADSPESLSDILLIIDEFQVTYRFPDDQLWPLLKMHQADANRQAHGLLVLLFAPYGKNEEEASESSSELTPLQKASSMAGLFTPIHIPYLFDATFLSFTEEEVESLLSRYNERAQEAQMVPFDETVSSFLFSFTKGHVGLTVETIQLIVQSWWSRETKTPATAKDIFAYLYSPGYFSSIKDNPRALSAPEKWSSSQLSVLQEALSSDDYSYHIRDDRHASVVRRGLMFRSVAKRDTLHFPSPLHRLMVSYAIHKTGRKFARDEFSAFLTTVIAHMDFKLILTSQSRHSPTSAVYERQFQMEFNRAALRTVGRAHQCFPDIGYACGARGYLDFYINNDLCWGVELARECHGTALEEHVGRFSPGGKYSQIPLNDAIVLNFVSASHYNDHPEPMVLEWKVVYQRDNFANVRLIRIVSGIKVERTPDLIQSVSSTAELLGQTAGSIARHLAAAEEDE